MTFAAIVEHLLDLLQAVIFFAAGVGAKVVYDWHRTVVIRRRG